MTDFKVTRQDRLAALEALDHPYDASTRDGERWMEEGGEWPVGDCDGDSGFEVFFDAEKVAAAIAKARAEGIADGRERQLRDGGNAVLAYQQGERMRQP